MPEAYSVSDLTAYLKTLLETDPILRTATVHGEVSNLTYHGSGHVYFTLKDPQAQLSCALFKMNAMRAPRLREGDKVNATGSISVYAPRGNYQFIVTEIAKTSGIGDLYRQFMELKERLQAEGLFDTAYKKPLPWLPKKICIVTSPTGAAVRDILRTIARRYPHLQVRIVPTIVQGAEGAASIVRSLQVAERHQPDVIILARGGGSLEDLWNFNEEAVARAIFACQVPIISGVGHETDTTIADFVADVRASTPTAAAEQVVPEADGIRAALAEWQQQLNQSIQYQIDFKRQVLDDYSHRLKQSVLQFFQQKRHELSLLDAQLAGLNHENILQQGYSITLRQGQIATSAAEFSAGEMIETIFADGRVHSRVE